MTSVTKPECFRTQIRLSHAMGDWVKEQASNNFRSFNGELVEMIRAAMLADIPQVFESYKAVTPQTPTKATTA